MGGRKTQQEFELNDDHVAWLQKMTEKYGLFDEDDKLLKTEFAENYALLLKNKKDSFSIKKLHYAGCPRWNYLDSPV